jgi:monofunctional biosynthetic peptidoglycan transglycosylase
VSSNRELRTGSVLIRFQEDPDASRWVAINDGVMGGTSSGGLRMSPEGVGVFEGNLSLENNGGFASVRTAPDITDVGRAAGIRVRVRGDGRTYRLRLRTDMNFDGIAYQSHFETVKGEWLEIDLPFASFTPTFRGRTVTGAEPLNTSDVRQLGFMIADKTPGPFRLEIEWVAAYDIDKRSEEP